MAGNWEGINPAKASGILKPKYKVMVFGGKGHVEDRKGKVLFSGDADECRQYAQQLVEDDNWHANNR